MFRIINSFSEVIDWRNNIRVHTNGIDLIYVVLIGIQYKK